MKKTKKIVSVLLTLCLMISVFACSGGGVGGDTSESTSEYVGTSEPAYPNLKETEYTNDKILDNGTCSYKIVVPEESNYGEDCAESELKDLFYEATNVNLETVFDSDVSYSDDAKFIVIGNTAFTENSGVDVSEIPHDGFRLKTVGKNLFVLGNDDGVTYGVYELLERILHYEYFLYDYYNEVDSYHLDHNVKNIYLPDIDYTDSPSFDVRADGWGFGGLRARSNDQNYPFMMNNVNPIHNSFDWFPKKSYQESHPGWYANNGAQLCYTAHGDETELAEMRTTLLKKFKQQVNAYWSKGDFTKTALSFTQQDDTSWCSCSACQKVINNAGANSATIIEFLNPIAKEMQTWVDANYPGKELDIVFFAYNSTEAAPVKKVNGNIVPTVEEVIMEPNLAVWTCLTTLEAPYGIDAARNSSNYAKVENWAALSNKMYLWTYDCNFVDFLTWYDTFDTLQGIFKHASNNGVKYLFSQGQFPSCPTQTAFNNFKASLTYKLMWDVDMDVKAYTERFFNTWFGPASKDMKAYYDSFRDWSDNTLKGLYGMSGSRLFQGFTPKYYPADKLNEWLDNINDAYESIKGLENTNSTYYEELLSRINAESIAVRYYLIQHHGSTYSSDEFRQMKLQFKQDATEWNFTKRAELNDIQELWDGWGV